MYPRIIAEKKTGLWIIYAAAAAICLVMLLFVVSEHVPWWGILIWIIMILVSLGSMISIFLAPDIAILIINPTQIRLAKGEIINLAEISRVEYHRAYARGIYYKWGSVSISYRGEEYKFKYIADCERVAEELEYLQQQALQSLYAPGPAFPAEETFPSDL